MLFSQVIKIWAAQVRAPFLLLPVMLVLISGGVAARYNSFNGLHFALAMIGVVLAHMAVNLFNEYSDHHTKIDHHTKNTPFSGGSGNLQSGATTPKAVWRAALLTSSLATGIGLYLTWATDIVLLVFILSGGLITFFYTTHLSKWAIGEIAAGLGLGSFVVCGAYFAITGTLIPEVILLSIPPGILTALLLLLNEFPDKEADEQGGRRHLVILLGRNKAAILYTLSIMACYIFIIIGAFYKWFPPMVLLALLTLPLAFKSSTTAMRHHNDFEKMLPALGANVGLVLGTDLLLAVAYFI